MIGRRDGETERGEESQGSLTYFAQTPESSLFNDGDIILVEVDVVQFPELSESVGGNRLEFVVGEDEVFEGPRQSRKTIWHQTVQPCNITQL